MGVLFPSDSQRNAEVLADAFAQKQVWDLRWYRFKLIAWSFPLHLVLPLFLLVQLSIILTGIYGHGYSDCSRSIQTASTPPLY